MSDNPEMAKSPKTFEELGPIYEHLRSEYFKIREELKNYKENFRKALDSIKELETHLEQRNDEFDKLVNDKYDINLIRAEIKADILEELQIEKMETETAPLPTPQEKPKKPLRVVIKGLDVEANLEEIENAVKSLGFKPTKICQLKSAKNLTPLPLFQLHLSDDEYHIFKVKEMMEKKIRVARYRPQLSNRQCWNCQLWGHLSYSCPNQTRCIKCAKEHRASQCPKKAEEKPICANCSKDHPANYRGCEAAPKKRPSRRRRPAETSKAPKDPNAMSQPRPPAENQPIRSPQDPENIKSFFRAICKLVVEKDFLNENQLEMIQDEMTKSPRKRSRKTPDKDLTRKSSRNAAA